MCDDRSRDEQETTTYGVTNARLAARLIELLGEPTQVVAGHIGVSRETVHRWRLRDTDELAGVEPPRGRNPARSHILHLRALVAVKRGVPSMYRTLRWGQEGFEQALDDVRPQRLMSEPDQTTKRPFVDGAEEI